VVWVDAESKLPSRLLLLVPVDVMSEEPIVELVVLSVKVRVGEDACLQEVVAKVSSLLEMFVDIR